MQTVAGVLVAELFPDQLPKRRKDAPDFGWMLKQFLIETFNCQRSGSSNCRFICFCSAIRRLPFANL